MPSLLIFGLTEEGGEGIEVPLVIFDDGGLGAWAWIEVEAWIAQSTHIRKRSLRRTKYRGLF